MSDQSTAPEVAPAAPSKKGPKVSRSIRTIEAAAGSIEEQKRLLRERLEEQQRELKARTEEQMRALEEKARQIRLEKLGAVGKAIREALKPVERKMTAIVKADREYTRKYIGKVYSQAEVDDLAQQLCEVLARAGRQPVAGEANAEAQGGQPQREQTESGQTPSGETRVASAGLPPMSAGNDDDAPNAGQALSGQVQAGQAQDGLAQDGLAQAEAPVIPVEAQAAPRRRGLFGGRS